MQPTKGKLLLTFGILALSKYRVIIGCVKRDPDCNMQATIIFFYKSAIFANEILQMSWVFLSLGSVLDIYLWIFMINFYPYAYNVYSFTAMRFTTSFKKWSIQCSPIHQVNLTNFDIAYMIHMMYCRWRWMFISQPLWDLLIINDYDSCISVHEKKYNN